MKRLAVLLLIVTLVACKPETHKDQLVFDRIEAIFNLKSVIDENTWKNFDDAQYDVPLIHYMDSFAYIANPTAKFLKIHPSELVYETSKLKIYKTGKLPDNDQFHMETGITFGDPEAYDDQAPFMKCSSLEKTMKIIPDVPSTELWMTMVIHEYFHGFQNKHKPFLNHLKTVIPVSEDSLKRIYKSNGWFKEGIDKENDLLLLALASADISETRTLINEFFRLRDERRKETFQKLKINIEKYESTYELMEGTARYVEYSLYQRFSDGKKDPTLSKTDPRYGHLKYFKDYQIEKDPWLYKSAKTGYFYATGFNMTRLLDKLGIEYKSRFFKDKNISLETLLRLY